MIKQVTMVGIGGFLGAVTRFALSGLVHRCYKGKFPAGTFVVNVIGCFIIGMFMYFAQEHRFFNPGIRLLIITGTLGAFTTFSTFGYETFQLIKSWSIQTASINIIINVLLGITAVVIGQLFARFIST